MRNSLLLALLCFGFANVAQGQDSVASEKNVDIRTNWPTAIVVADGSILGIAANSPFNIPAETKLIRLLPPVEGTWDIKAVEADISEMDKDSIVVSLPFLYYYKFESAPHAARVILNNSQSGTYLGSTPFVYVSEGPLVNDVEYQLQGYRSETIRPGDEIWNRYLVDLPPLDASTVNGGVAWAGKKKRRWWIDAAAVTTAATAGALAVHYKFKADNRFDEFQQTGNPDLRPGIERFDTYSGVSLGFMQAGIGVFAIRLVLR